MGRIVNYGSLNIDRVYQVDHIVTPGETISSTDYQVFPGGKGLNQSVALARSGADVRHGGAVGADGVWLVELLADNGVDCTGVQVLECATGHALIQVDRNGQNCIMLYGGANRAIPPETPDSVLRGYGPGDYLALQNEVNGNETAIRLAKRQGMEVVLNPSPMDDMALSLPLEQVDWLLLNEVEGKAMTGRSDPGEICGSLLSRYPAMRVVLTLGKEGVRYQDKDYTHRHGIYDVPVVDTTAAGDTFTGFFLGSVAAGAEIPEALRLASIASSLAVSRPGAAVSVPTMAEVRDSKIQLL